MSWLKNLIVSRGVSKALSGDSKFFTLVGFAVFAVRLARRLSGTDEKHLFSHEMKHGDKVVIDTTGHLKK